MKSFNRTRFVFAMMIIVLVVVVMSALVSPTPVGVLKFKAGVVGDGVSGMWQGLVDDRNAFWDSVNEQLAILVIAPAGDTSVSIFDSPTDVAKAFLEALTRFDVDTMQSNLCEARRGDMTDASMAEAREAMAVMAAMAGGVSYDFSGVTYIYNESASTVTVGGEVIITVAGQTNYAPASSLVGSGSLPVVQEGGGWRVCPTGVTG